MLGFYLLPRVTQFPPDWARVPIIKVELPTFRDIPHRVKAVSPNTLVMARLDPGEYSDGGLKSPNIRADALIRLAGEAGGPQVVDVLMGDNEKSYWKDISVANAFDADFCRRVRNAGYLSATSSWSVGTFPATEEEMSVLPRYREALEQADFLNIHAYAVPGQTAQWTAHRHELFWDHLPVKPRVGLLIGEVAPWDGQGHGRGWRTVMSEELAIQFYQGYTRRVEAWAREKGTVVRAAVFGLGPGFGWQEFDHQGRLAEWIASTYRAEPWRLQEKAVIESIFATLPRKRFGDILQPKDVEAIIVHHTATPPETRPEVIARYHTMTRGWWHIGYHFLIPPDGRILQSLPWNEKGYHANAKGIEWNHRSIAVALIGDFTKAPPTEAQARSLKRLLPLISEHFGGRELKIMGHRDAIPGYTVCPGLDVQAWLNLTKIDPDEEADLRAENATLRQRVRDLTVKAQQAEMRLASWKQWASQMPE